MAETKQRTFRVDDEVWQAAMEKAAMRDEKVSDVLRQALSDYSCEACGECSECGAHELDLDTDPPETTDTATIIGRGRFSETTNPDVQALIDRAKELLAEGAVGVSIATDLNPDDLGANPDAWEDLVESASIRPRHVAIVDTPAFSGAYLDLADDGTVSGPIVLEGQPTGDLRMLPYHSLVWDEALLPIPIIFDLQDGDHTGVTVGFIDALERVEGTDQTVAPLTASVDNYPAYLFSEPEPTAMTVHPKDAKGYRRYTGILAPTGVCHKGRGGCYTYKGASLDYFHSGARIHCDDNSTIRVGPLMFGDLHADSEEFNYAKALTRTNEDARSVFAMGRCFHHPKGLLFSGVLMEDADLMRIQATAPSVELWPDHRGRLELKTALQVPRPALPVAASLTGGGLQLAEASEVLMPDDMPDEDTAVVGLFALDEAMERLDRIERGLALLVQAHLTGEKNDDSDAG